MTKVILTADQIEANRLKVNEASKISKRKVAAKNAGLTYEEYVSQLESKVILTADQIEANRLKVNEASKLLKRKIAAEKKGLTLDVYISQLENKVVLTEDQIRAKVNEASRISKRKLAAAKVGLTYEAYVAKLESKVKVVATQTTIVAEVQNFVPTCLTKVDHIRAIRLANLAKANASRVAKKLQAQVDALAATAA